MDYAGVHIGLSGFGPREHTKINTDMKRTYIKPETTVVTFNAEQIICDSIHDVKTLTGFSMGEDSQSAGVTEAGSREVIKSPDVWEEW